MDVATFFRGSSFIGDHWGMGSMLTGGGGIKALFTGDSGTGKTLAAEVIAGELGLPLLRVELARIMALVRSGAPASSGRVQAIKRASMGSPG